MTSEHRAVARSGIDNRTQNFRNGVFDIRYERFADDDIVGDCVARSAHLSAFAVCDKAQNSVDDTSVPVQRALRDSNMDVVAPENTP